MGTYEFRLPDIGEGVVEGEIVAWHVKVGDTVREDDPLLEVMTDKATVVISSPHEGNLLEACYEAGDIAEVGSVLFVLDIEGTGEAADSAETQPQPKPRQPKKSGVSVETQPYGGAEVSDPGTAPTAPVPVAPVPRGSGKVLATPATRRLARRERSGGGRPQ